MICKLINIVVTFRLRDYIKIVYQKGNKWEQQNGYTVLYARIKQEQKSERILS